ncbi:metallophosphoesterase [Thalassotalea mangrovi]|nr:metallophosphoesterase [Thalassotalea mangrovi]
MTSFTALSAKQPFNLSTDEKVIIVGDIHGDFEGLSGLLIAAGVIDLNLNWQAGKTHFVSVGDLLDRGPDSRKVMDFFMRLETQASSQGGAVHVVLGNHELMNLVRDLRYVTDQDYDDYRAEESTSLRNDYWQRFQDSALNASRKVNQQVLRADFERQYPPGYFGHMQEFSAAGNYGSWLMSKPSMLKINDLLFVHGGLSSDLPQIALSQINQQSSAAIRAYLQAYWELEKRLPLYQMSTFFDGSKTLEEFVSNSQSDIEPYYQKFISAEQSFYLGGTSQYWYRGSALCHPIYEEEILDTALQHFQAKRLVIGHTPTLSRKIESRMNGKVINVDTGLYRDYYHGNPMLLSIHQDKLEQFDGSKWLPFSTATQQFRQTYHGQHYENWEDYLKNAEVKAIEPLKNGELKREMIQLDLDGQTFSGIFTNEHKVSTRAARAEYDNTYSYKYEVAAYKIARTIGLYMIPPTVLREVNDKEGALQLSIDKSFSEATRLAKNYYPNEGCVLAYQANLMRLFDYLIYNSNRSSSNVRYTGDWRMWLSQHTHSFRTHTTTPDSLRSNPIPYSKTLELALKNLDKQNIEEVTQDLLTTSQLNAIFKRRDKLLELWHGD